MTVADSFDEPVTLCAKAWVDASAARPMAMIDALTFISYILMTLIRTPPTDSPCCPPVQPYYKPTSQLPAGTDTAVSSRRDASEMQPAPQRFGLLFHQHGGFCAVAVLEHLNAGP